MTSKTMTIGLLLLALLASSPGWAAKNGELCRDSTTKCMNRNSRLLQQRGWAGLELDRNGSGGLAVTKVLYGSPALEAGIREGDLLVSLNGEKLSADNHDAASLARNALRAGAEAVYVVSRDGSNKEITLTLAAIPPAVMGRWVSMLAREDSDNLDLS